MVEGMIKMKNKGFASSLIIFSLLTLFLITLFMLMNTLNNTSSLNNNVKKNIINELNYDESNSTSIENRLSALENKISTLEDKIYPVGSIYMSLTDETIETVTEKFGGTWEKMENTFLIGASSNYQVGTTGGTATHKHESPVNTLGDSLVGVNNKFGTNANTLGNFYGATLSSSQTGGNYTAYYTSEESNIPPYTAVYMYKRVK
jgi:hypothetical protein